MKRRAWLLATLALAACEQPAAPLSSRPWNTFDLQQAFIDQTRVLEGVEGFPAGFPHDTFVKSAQPLIPISSAFTEGGFSPYITTNLWANVPEVWIQPMYILVTGWDDQTHDWKKLAGAGWIYTVGPKSRFHSPFWRVYWAKVPKETSPTHYTSAEQLLRDGVELIPGPGRLVTLVPDGTVLGEPPAAPFSVPMLALPKIRAGQDYLGGEKVTAIDFGADRFEWNEDQEVIEQPFFVLLTCDKGGNCQPSGAPNVGGTGPLFARRPALLPDGRPRFGSFWRLHFVALPEGDGPGLFVPRNLPPELSREAIRASVALPTPDPGFDPDVDRLAEVNKHFMQVALNSQCFATQATFETCQWLDSQKAIEELLPQAIQRTGITVTCPFVAYDGKDIVEVPMPPKPMVMP
jgi:hypothetical protein